jgi:formylglycine-generating enzyme required for sulfatase activity
VKTKENMSKITTQVAQRRIESFTKRFGKAHLYLAYHAAFPLALTPDLLYRLWAHFQRDIHGEVLNIPWVTVADLLLSNLCDEVGYELYEIDLAVRNQLLRQLKEDEKFGQQRIQELSHFILYYVRQQLHSDDPDVKDFAQTQRWTALAYTQPGEAVRELALVFSKLGEKDTPELVRMASLTETMAEPLVDFQPLLIYARGMKKFVCGDLEAAKVEFDKALTEKNEIIVADINLPIPEQIAPPKTQQNKNLSRRRLIQYLGWGGVGLGLTVGGAYFFSSRDNLQTSEFEVVTVDARGNITNRRRSQAKFFVEDLGNGVLLNMVEIPGGTFAMGSPPNEAGRSGDEGPQHQVTVPRFFMGRYEVTQSQYEAIMGNNPSNFKDNGANRPVETVSWNDAVEFCKRLSQKTGRTYRLPSEAEWEYACRAGTSTPFHFGETITADLANYHSEVAYASAPTKKARGQTTPVGSFSANAFGLYDMHGNVWEWCQDIWYDNYKGCRW